ncbi:ribose ABC transporter permease [Spirochaetia bacterium]|nr:ribose ABC transporter permease [Spirochaetia bacterium]
MNFSVFVRKYGVILMLAGLIIVFSILRGSTFLTFNNFMNVARQVSMLTIVAVGMTMVLLAGGIDLSVGSQMAIISVSVALLIRDHNVPPFAACLLGLGLTTLVGFINGMLITFTKIAPLIATLAMQIILSGTSYIMCGGMPVYGLPGSIKAMAQNYVFGIVPIPVIIMVVIVLLGAFLLVKTYPGRYIRAIGSNEEATRLSGINVRFYRVLVYTISGFLAGFAGLILLGRVSSGQPSAGKGFEMDVLTAIVLGGVSVMGGKGKMSGAFLGVMIIGILNNGMSIMAINDYYQLVIKGVVLLIAVIFDSLQFLAVGKKKAAAVPVESAAK